MAPRPQEMMPQEGSCGQGVGLPALRGGPVLSCLILCQGMAVRFRAHV